MKNLGGIYCLRNESEQMYFFENISSQRSYRLTSTLANLRNRRFYEISDPGVECFAPLEAGGKPSTRFPPRELVELSIVKNMRETFDNNEIYV